MARASGDNAAWTARADRRTRTSATASRRSTPATSARRSTPATCSSRTAAPPSSTSAPASRRRRSWRPSSARGSARRGGRLRDPDARPPRPRRRRGRDDAPAAARESRRASARRAAHDRPSKLWAGALAVYGEERDAPNYGELVPVPQRAGDRGRRTAFASSSAAGRCSSSTRPATRGTMSACGTRPRAACSRGDTFGLAYPRVRQRPRPVPAADHDARAVRARRARGLDRSPARLRPADGCTSPTTRSCATRRALAETCCGAASASWSRSLRRPTAAATAAFACVRPSQRRWSAGRSITAARCPSARIRELLAVDIELNSQGLEVWLDRGRRA